MVVSPAQSLVISDSWRPRDRLKVCSTLRELAEVPVNTVTDPNLLIYLSAISPEN